MTKPYPGAFTHLGDRNLLVWSAALAPAAGKAKPGTILSASPLIVACGKDALQINLLQVEGGVCLGGA